MNATRACIAFASMHRNSRGRQAASFEFALQHSTPAMQELEDRASRFD
ncbi:hypothetical protein [Paraburkholderia dipogonis]